MPAPPPGETEQGGENIPLIPLVPATPGDTGQEEGSIPLIPLVPATPIVPDSTPEEGAEEKPPANDGLSKVEKAALPTDPAQAATADMPGVQVIANLVVDAFGKYTGAVEISLKVETPSTEAFRLIGTALRYNKDVLTPVDFAGNIIETTSTANYSVTLPTRKSDAVSAGMARVGGTDGFLYLGAESDWGVTIEGAVADVPLVVVRFKYDKTTAPMTFDAVNNQFLDKSGAPIELFGWIDETANPTCFEGNPAGQALWYESGDTSFYYVPAYDADNTKTEEVTLNLGGTDYKYQAPVTVGKRVAAVKATGNPANDTDFISYFTNHMTGKVSMNAVSRESDDGKGSSITMNDVATVVFFDWDDSLLGATVVARGVDNRKTVNDFVRDNMVHPALHTATSAQLETLDRQYTYRGEYPCIDPNTGDTFPDDHATQPGKNYPITNKLDYAFYKSFDDEFDYDDGWLEVDPLTMADTWTALEAGYVAPTEADFTDILTGTVYVKALYEPGDKLNYGASGTAYTALPENYEIYTVPSYTAGDYAIKFQYIRVNKEEYGVTRRRDPAVKTTLVPDAIGAKGFLLENTIQNSDVIQVTLTPSKAIAKVDYVLVERYGWNFATGSTISTINGNGTFVNYTNGTGTDGFVKRATWSYFMNQVKLYISGQANEFDMAHITGGVLNDCGFMNYDGKYFSGTDVADSVDYDLPDLFKNAKNAGLTTLSFYQLQYGIFNYGTLLTDSEAKEWYWKEFYPGSAHDKAGIHAIEP